MAAQTGLWDDGVDHLVAWEPDEWAMDAAWLPVVKLWQQSGDGLKLAAYLRERLAAGATIFPPKPLRALQETPLAKVRVVIVGQDPYHGLAQAEGLAFSVSRSAKIPPSLRNIHKELVRDGEISSAPAHGSLINWARNGVLLLNTSLTVEMDVAASHARKGWESLTDGLLKAVAENSNACVYLLWGGHAQAKEEIITVASRKLGNQALVLKANHPSPLSALRAPVPFIGCGHFGQARRWLAERGISVNWALDE